MSGEGIRQPGRSKEIEAIFASGKTVMSVIDDKVSFEIKAMHFRFPNSQSYIYIYRHSFFFIFNSYL